MRNGDFYKAVERVFREYYQTTIEEMRQGHPQYGDMPRAAVINIQDDFLTSEINKRNVYFNWEKLTDAQCDVYYKALAQQLYYILKEYDFSATSGYNEVTNTFMQKSELTAHAMSPAAKATLEAAGLFYPGLGAGAHNFRRGWRW